MSADPTGERAAQAVGEFLAVMRRLRAECPWKREQTHRSLARYLLEETHETLEAIDTGDTEHLREELGDLLLQVVFHAVVAEETAAFDLADVVDGITAKMIRRNPHVFAPEDAAGTPAPADAAAVDALWQQVKAAEKGRRSVEEGVPVGLPALLYADQILGRLERAGRDASVGSGAAGPDDLGERLLALVAEGRAAGTDPEQALRDAVRRRLG